MWVFLFQFYTSSGPRKTGTGFEKLSLCHNKPSKCSMSAGNNEFKFAEELLIGKASQLIGKAPQKSWTQKSLCVPFYSGYFVILWFQEQKLASRYKLQHSQSICGSFYSRLWLGRDKDLTMHNNISQASMQGILQWKYFMSSENSWLWDLYQWLKKSYKLFKPG